MDYGADLYRRYLDGDETAFVEMVDIYREGLIFFLCRYVGNLTAAEDLAEDVFVEVLLHPKRYRFQCALKTWLFTIGRNKAVDYIRKTSRLSLAPLEEAAQSADLKTLEEQVLDSEEKRALNLAMGRIPEDYRMALHLIYFEGLGQEEAGKVMGKSRKQVENLVFRGRQSLRKILEEEGFGFEEQR